MSEKNLIFIGNTGEKDPEISETLGRKYPSQVKKVWIRNVNNSNQARTNGLEENQWNDGSDENKRIMQ